MTANRMAQKEKKGDYRIMAGLSPNKAGKAGLMLAAGLCALILLAGCGDKKPGANRLHPRGTPFLTGVPVPNGFKLVDRMSEDYESGSSRFARHQYSGSGDLVAVRDFYVDQMPLMGWSQISTQNVKGVIQMRFEKKTEECTVEIEGGGFGRVTIQVIVKPFSRNPNEAPRRPLP